jgi:hypothetical protein
MDARRPPDDMRRIDDWRLDRFVMTTPALVVAQVGALPTSG